MIRRWRAKSADYREMRRKHRRHKRELASEHARERIQRDNVLLGAALAVAGAAIYSCWQVVRGTAPDPVGVVLAALVPSVIYAFSVYANGYRRAGVLAYGQYRGEHEARNPPSPWEPVYEIIPGDLGVKVALRLHLSRRVSAAEAGEIRCTLYTDETYSVGIGVAEPIKHVRVKNDASSYAGDEPVEFIYPDDFDKPKWPLDARKYPVVWEIRGGDGSSTSVGSELKIKRRWVRD